MVSLRARVLVMATASRQNTKDISHDSVHPASNGHTSCVLALRVSSSEQPRRATNVLLDLRLIEEACTLEVNVRTRAS
jgi:hypothetical protein